MAHGEDVEVKFGASLTGLTAGVNKVKEEIESFRAPVEHFVESLKGVVGGRASDFWNLARTCARLGTHYNEGHRAAAAACDSLKSIYEIDNKKLF